ncbi:MAG: hypothetical protein ACFFCD_15510 [Promethearchaeota archaeon]
MNSNTPNEDFKDLNEAIKSFLKKPSILSEIETPFEKVLGYNFSKGDLDYSVYEKVKELITSGKMFKIEESGEMIVLE